MGLAHFKYYDYRMAEAVTSTGQLFIKKTQSIIDAMLTKISGGADGVSYLDTDSVVGDTLVYVNGKQMPISELYDIIGETYAHKDESSRNFVKPVTSMTTKSFNSSTELIEDKPIKYVMKHAVKKRMFKITIGDRSVTVTEDHSVIVNRDGSYVSVSPKELTRTDLLVNITTPQGVSLYEAKEAHEQRRT